MTEWVTLGTEQMEQAQAATGLSHERLARQLPVSEKTWRRWVQRGQVPRHELPKVAEILGLEIEIPDRRPLSVDGTPREGSPELVEIRETLADLAREVAGLAAVQQQQTDEIAALRRELAPTSRRARERG